MSLDGWLDDDDYGGSIGQREVAFLMMAIGYIRWLCGDLYRGIA